MLDAHRLSRGEIRADNPAGTHPSDRAPNRQGTIARARRDDVEPLIGAIARVAEGERGARE